MSFSGYRYGREGQEMTIERVLKILNGYLDQANKLKFVRKPYAWALFQTWRVVDEIEKERKEHV